jgi:aldose 1-epimerase
MKATVTYSIVNDALVIDYKAVADKKTPIGLTNHSYFNLDGFGGDIKNHKLKIFAKTYTEADKEIVPTGNHPELAGSLFDFTELRRIGDGIDAGLSGYDHNFVLTPEIYESYLGKDLGLAAIVENESLRLSVYTDQPGIQLYSGNGLAGNADFKGGIKAVKYGGLCLETQHFPDSPNQKSFPSTTLRPNEVYDTTTIFKFQAQ